MTTTHSVMHSSTGIMFLCLVWVCWTHATGNEPSTIGMQCFVRVIYFKLCFLYIYFFQINGKETKLEVFLLLLLFDALYILCKLSMSSLLKCI